MGTEYMVGSIIGEIILAYVIYWIIKKITINQIKKPLTKKQKAKIAGVAILLWFLLVLLRVLR